MDKRNLVLLLILLTTTLPAGLHSQEAKLVTSYRIGAIKISTLSELQDTGNTQILIGATPQMVTQCLPQGTFSKAVNAFLVQTPDKTILIDAGFGRKLFDHLASLNILPEEIDIVLLTHMHGDHIGGLLKDGKAAFPKAKLYIAQAEYDYWQAGNHTAQQQVIDIYKNNLELFTPNVITDSKTSLLTGVYGIAAYGHTPGHTAFLFESENEQLLVWGDLTHAMQIQMSYPEVAVTYDIDPKKAIQSRKAILAYVAEKNIPIAGMHIAFPGIGKVASAGDGYQFTPIN